MNASVSDNYTKPYEFDSGSPDENRTTTIILSIVMPVLLVLFCIGYAVWDMERSTRPDQARAPKKQPRVQTRLQTKKTLKVQPRIMSIDQENKENKETQNASATREILLT